jgi:HTH-type transcriptional regulator, competence development regulator
MADSERSASPVEKTQGSPLGQHLAAIRTDRGFSLRQVEDLTNKLVSNAYLSQIEKGKVLHPSPNILHALSQAYRTSYEQLMELAGFITTTREKNSAHGRAATFAELNLTEAEERELLEYLKFRRSVGGSSGEGR